MLNYFKLLIIFLSIPFTLLSQDFSNDQQYKQAMQNGKQAFEAKQYSNAVMFYNEALKLKPAENLPRYRIEDIRTIYIKKELDTIQIVNNQPDSKTKKLSKKEADNQKKILQTQVEQKATEKMYNDAQKVKDEILTVQTVNVIDINDMPLDIDSTTITGIEKSRETGLMAIDIKKQNSINMPVDTVQPQLAAIQRKAPQTSSVTAITSTQKTPENNITPTPQINFDKPKPAVMSETEKKNWVEQEQKRLAKKYPAKKTVENIDQVGKHITRVIINIDNKVSVYLKVEHNWGATFYFKDETGLELRSINLQYFNLMTDLKTYGH